MDNIQEQAKILTEEEVNAVESLYSLQYEEIAKMKPSLVRLIVSHRSLNSRNRKLVLENDELLAEVEMLKKLIFKLDAHIDFSEPLTAGELIEFKDVTGINQVYKEVYRIVNPAQSALNEAMEEHAHE